MAVMGLHGTGGPPPPSPAEGRLLTPASEADRLWTPPSGLLRGGWETGLARTRAGVAVGDALEPAGTTTPETGVAVAVAVEAVVAVGVAVAVTVAVGVGV